MSDAIIVLSMIALGILLAELFTIGTGMESDDDE
jgi:hypothetical protein